MAHIAPRQPVRWGHADLLKLKMGAVDGLTLMQLAVDQGPGVSAQDCDRALWAMLGRTIPQACDVLNGGPR